MQVLKPFLLLVIVKLTPYFISLLPDSIFNGISHTTFANTGCFDNFYRFHNIKVFVYLLMQRYKYYFDFPNSFIKNLHYLWILFRKYKFPQYLCPIKSRGRAVGVLAWPITRRSQVQVLLPLPNVFCFIIPWVDHNPLAARSGGFLYTRRAGARKPQPSTIAARLFGRLRPVIFSKLISLMVYERYIGVTVRPPQEGTKKPVFWHFPTRIRVWLPRLL